MHEDSCIGINYASHVLQVIQVTSHIVRFRSLLRIVNSIVVAVPIYSILTCTRIFLVEIHTAKTGLVEVLSLHLPSVAADRRQL